MKVTEQQVLEKMRKICLALPGTEEKISHGHPSFRTSKGFYAVLEEYRGELSICVKVGLEVQGVFLEDPNSIHRTFGMDLAKGPCRTLELERNRRTTRGQLSASGRVR